MKQKQGRLFNTATSVHIVFCRVCVPLYLFFHAEHKQKKLPCNLHDCCKQNTGHHFGRRRKKGWQNVDFSDVLKNYSAGDPHMKFLITSTMC